MIIKFIKVYKNLISLRWYDDFMILIKGKSHDLTLVILLLHLTVWLLLLDFWVTFSTTPRIAQVAFLILLLFLFKIFRIWKGLEKVGLIGRKNFIIDLNFFLQEIFKWLLFLSNFNLIKISQSLLVRIQLFISKFSKSNIEENWYIFVAFSFLNFNNSFYSSYWVVLSCHICDIQYIGSRIHQHYFCLLFWKPFF